MLLWHLVREIADMDAGSGGRSMDGRASIPDFFVARDQTKSRAPSPTSGVDALAICPLFPISLQHPFRC